jgi:hypothetical protein
VPPEVAQLGANVKKIKDISKEEAVINNLVYLQERYRKQAILKVTAALVLGVLVFALVMGFVLTLIPQLVDKWFGL